MRKRIAAALLLLSPAGVAAQQQDALPVETVESISLDTLTGIWKISFPTVTATASVPLMGDGRLSYSLGEAFCRITHATGDAAAVICLMGGDWRGTATLEDGKLHFALGAFPLKLIIEADYKERDSFSGLFGVRILAFSVDAVTPATAHRRMVPETAPDTAGLGGLVSARLTQVAGGYVASPGDVIARQFHRTQLNSAKEIQPLGKVEAVLYLGEGSRRQSPAKKGDPEPPPFTYSVYQVEFENGQRLCAAHDRGDGVLDGFFCV